MGGGFLAGPAPTPVFVAEAPLSEPIANAGRSRVLKILVNGDVVMARLDQEDRHRIGGRQYAFPKERKEPIVLKKAG